ncbi:hypothetical protein HanIR_Chr15g0747091 [Helianthus annuus]|nr:hypothetical protein HanIR_Chr15g0747091 [Helianthus annuus]
MTVAFLTLVAVVVTIVEVRLVGHSIPANTWALQARYCLRLEEVVTGPTAQHFRQVDIKVDHLEKLTRVDPDAGYRYWEWMKSH